MLLLIIVYFVTMKIFAITQIALVIDGVHQNVAYILQLPLLLALCLALSNNIQNEYKNRNVDNSHYSISP